ncbi:hypothetical protein [Pseudoalteromonas sp. C8]|uniref:hypothetical protein n=1 Tax=Pseudoalteromonas sp. C8 TaxID=2686345 RepID=UPI0013FE4312|nr:hypothetical protein [Pseudoalteromonas sp. C8]
MKISKSISKKIYESKVYFKDIIIFLDLISSKDELLNGIKVFYISFSSGEDVRYTFDSIEDVLNIDNIKALESTRISSFDLFIDNTIVLQLDPSFIEINYEINSRIGHLISDIAIETLKLRTSSVFGFIERKPFHFIIFSTLLYTLINIFIYQKFHFISFVIFFFSISFIKFLTEIMSRAKILMSNNNDSFLIRKADDLKIAGAFLCLGYVLGAIFKF